MLKLFKIIQTKKEKFFNVFLICLLAFVVFTLITPAKITSLLSPVNNSNLTPLQNGKNGYEVFGFAPYWNMNKLDNVDFSVLTTFAYFGIPVNEDGTLDTTDIGYQTFESRRATEIFKKAHQNGTKVVLTLTQMNNEPILALMDNKEGQKNLIKNVTRLVKKRGIDGINIDFEYIGDPGEEYRHKFTLFAKELTSKMHEEIPSSQVTVSVYASAVKYKKIYDIKGLAAYTDGIFMMAYDFATTSSDNAIPTSPLNGHKEGKYWYDISTAVDDFLTQMPPEKLILGLPWYGYNYPVNAPQVKAETQKGYYASYWYRYRKYYRYVAPPASMAQPYAVAKSAITPASVSSYTTGWDKEGKVGYTAYQENGSWRIIFLEDEKSLGIKYDFAKGKKLAGVGMWALGFESGTNELWDLLSQKFGKKLANNYVVAREISNITNE